MVCDFCIPQLFSVPPQSPSLAQCGRHIMTQRHNAAFPMGLPEFDPVRLTIEGGDGLEVT